LEIQTISKRYGDVVALREMTFEVRVGELFGFVGSNGAGKTTAMRIIMGVLAADSGEVRWGGQPITLSARRRMGYMPEERGLYPRMRVVEQLVYLARLHGVPVDTANRATDALLARLGLTARGNDMVQALSLGNQQRVQLAAAMVHEPGILILDEPFSGLDPVAVDVMSDVLREKCAQGIPVIFSSHQLDLVERLCDRVGIVRDGRLVACGSIEELRADAPERLLVDAPGAPSDWADQLPGVEVRDRTGTRTLLELKPGADDQQILRTALATGPVREFARSRPTLTELFRHVVSEEEAAA
jgi:ABC-2 type transport system ATP-binding protein